LSGAISERRARRLPVKAEHERPARGHFGAQLAMLSGAQQLDGKALSS